MHEPQKIHLNLSFEIPPEYVLITKAEYEELQHDRLVGQYWTLADLEERTKRKRLWLQENILYVPRFKKELEKFVHYPKYGGDKWLFQATKMTKFLEDNFYRIFNP